MFKVKFLDENQKWQHVWQTSWGITTRSIGILVMVHGDDKGLVLPPRVAPIQVICIPIFYKDQPNQKLSSYLQEIYQNIKKQHAHVRIHLDDRLQLTPGWKYAHWE